MNKSQHNEKDFTAPLNSESVNNSGASTTGFPHFNPSESISSELLLMLNEAHSNHSDQHDWTTMFGGSNLHIGLEYDMDTQDSFPSSYENVTNDTIKLESSRNGADNTTSAGFFPPAASDT